MTITDTAPDTLVTSADGTQIAVFITGQGRPLVLVPGSTADHTTWRLTTPLLAEHARVHAVDRRGRGGSGDHPDYALSREYDDIAAVVDAAAAAFGGPVDLLGHSFGGNVAFGAATRTSNLRRLVLYEGWPAPNIAHRTFPADLLTRLDTLLVEGRSEEALEVMLRDIVHLAGSEIDTLKAAPTWPIRVATAQTLPRELRAFGAHAFEAADAARIRVPVLLLVGEESPEDLRADPEVVAGALPDARIRVLPGQAHIAHVTDPVGFAAEVARFLYG